MDPTLTAAQFIEALAIFREARGESMPAKAAMLAVIRNRAASGWLGDHNTTDVIWHPWQFSSFNSSDPNSRVWPKTETPGQWQAWIDCCNVVTLPMTADPTEGAVFYEATPDGVTRPDWADPSKMTVQIGKTRFYRL